MHPNTLDATVPVAHKRYICMCSVLLGCTDFVSQNRPQNVEFYAQVCPHVSAALAAYVHIEHYSQKAKFSIQILFRGMHRSSPSVLPTPRGRAAKCSLTASWEPKTWGEAAQLSGRYRPRMPLCVLLVFSMPIYIFGIIRLKGPFLGLLCSFAFYSSPLQRTERWIGPTY